MKKWNIEYVNASPSQAGYVEQVIQALENNAVGQATKRLNHLGVIYNNSKNEVDMYKELLKHVSNTESNLTLIKTVKDKIKAIEESLKQVDDEVKKANDMIQEFDNYKKDFRDKLYKEVIVNEDTVQYVYDKELLNFFIDFVLWIYVPTGDFDKDEITQE